MVTCAYNTSAEMVENRGSQKCGSSSVYKTGKLQGQ